MRNAANSIQRTFQQTARPRQSVTKAKCPSPFSLRLTTEERAYLNEKAGARPLGEYIRAQLLGVKKAKRRQSRKPKINDQLIATVLSELGASRLSSNVNQLAKAANMGTLDVSAETEHELQQACAAIIGMRNMLITALGLKSEEDLE